MYSWDLGKTEVPECAAISFANNQIIPGTWDKNTKVKYIWLDYTIQACNSCNDRLRDEFKNGDSAPDRSNIKIKIQNLLEFTEGEMAFVKIRSFYFNSINSNSWNNIIL